MSTINKSLNSDTLLQNATNIIGKCNKILLQKMSAFLLENVTYLLQNVTGITKI